MDCVSFYHKCSAEYIRSLDDNLMDNILRLRLPGTNDRATFSRYIFWQLVNVGWSFSIPAKEFGDRSPNDLNNVKSIEDISRINNPELCITSSRIQSESRADYAKEFNSNLVQMEVQFGEMEEIAKDFTKFRIAFAEKRIALGIEINFESSSKDSSFEEAQNMLTLLNLDCPIWLLGIR